MILSPVSAPFSVPLLDDSCDNYSQETAEGHEMRTPGYAVLLRGRPVTG
jgi:hypothetical protein